MGIERRRRGWLWLGVALLCAGGEAAAAESFRGKVIAVADGDTITVLRDRTQVKVRLHGIDAPEKAQAFGEQAKLFTSNLVFGKEVRVEVATKDRYGRTVGTVFLESPARCLNEELLKAGLAWWYRQYSPKEKKLAELEEEARKARRGLWADAGPTAPWEWRHPDLGCTQDADCVFLPTVCTSCAPCKPTLRRVGNRAALARIRNMQARVRCARPTCQPCSDPKNWLEGQLACVSGRCTLTRTSAPPPTASGVVNATYRGNVRSRVLHAPGCKDHECKSCTDAFLRVEDAKRAGYRAHGCVARFETCYARCIEKSRAHALAADAIEAACRRSCTK